jgi:predicted Zn-dependent peptidase
MTTANGDGNATFQETTLDNGMCVLTSQMEHTRSVSVSVYVGVGSRYETDERAGISHLVEHLVFKGTEKRPTPAEISGAVEGVGGMMNASTEQEMTAYWCKVARPYLPETLDLLIDMLRNSVLDPSEVERERLVVVEEQNMINDFPNQKVEAIIDDMLWPGHPLGRDIAGNRESVMGTTRDMVSGFIEQYYLPSNMVVSVAGNVEHDDVVRQVDALCDGWKPGTPPGWTPFAGKQAEPGFRLETRRTEQSHLVIAVPGISNTHPDRYAIDLMSVVLGEGMSSRLFIEIREKRGLAYDIHSGVTHFRDCGAFMIAAGVDPKRMYAAVDTILAEVGRIRETVPDEEMDKAKRLSTGTLMLRMEDTRAVSGWAGAQQMLLGRVLEMDEVVESINSVTAEDVRRVANDLLQTEKLNLAVVGPSRGGARFRRSLKL